MTAVSNHSQTGEAGLPLAVVTGATGFLGRHLCQRLPEFGYRVRAVVRPGRAAQLDGAEVVESELQDSAGMASAIADAVVVFHLAGIAHVGFRDPSVLQQVNVQGTRSVVDACLRAGVPRLVYFSSILANRPLSPYARSKQQAESLVLKKVQSGFEPVVLRPVNVYGVGMKGGLMSMVRGIANRRLPPLPRLRNRLALVSADDVSQAAILAGRAPAAVGKTYTVSDGHDYTPNSIEAEIYRVLGRKKPGWRSPRMVFLAAATGSELAASLGLVKGGFGLNSYRTLVSDSGVSAEELSRDTGFRPSLTLLDLLPRIVEDLA